MTRIRTIPELVRASWAKLLRPTSIRHQLHHPRQPLPVHSRSIPSTGLADLQSPGSGDPPPGPCPRLSSGIRLSGARWIYPLARIFLCRDGKGYGNLPVEPLWMVSKMRLLPSRLRDITNGPMAIVRTKITRIPSLVLHLSTTPYPIVASISGYFRYSPGRLRMM